MIALVVVVLGGAGFPGDMLSHDMTVKHDMQASIGSADTLTFSLPLTSSGIDAMLATETVTTDATINGSAVTATAQYRESGATSSSWVALTGPTLARGGGAPTLDVATPFVTANNLDAASQAVTMPFGSYYSDVYDATMEPGTDDFMIEVVSKGAASSGKVFSYRSTLPRGWTIWMLTSSVSMQFYDGATVGSVSSTVDPNRWNHIVACLDSGNNASLYANGVLVGTDTIVPALTMSDGTGAYAIGSYTGGNGATGANVAYASAHQKAGWFTSSTDCASYAAKRASALWGGRPDVANGSEVPTVRTRASVAMVDIYDGTQRRLFPVGNNALPRVVVRQDADGTARANLLREPQATNLVLQSANLATTWTATAATIGTDVVAAPDGATDADGVIGDATSAVHYAAQGSVTVSTATQYTASGWFKAGNKTNGHLLVDGCIAAGASHWFDLSTCTSGTVGGDSTAIEDWGGGWCRVSTTFTTDTASACRVQISPAVDAVSNETFVGDGTTTNIYAWGMQLEAAPTDDLPSSYIATTTATVTRSEDQLRYDGVGNVPTNTHTMVASIDYTSPVNSGVNARLYSLSVGGMGNNMCAFYYSSADAVSTWCQTPSGVVKQITSVALTATGNRRTFQANWLDQGGLVEILDDGTQIASGTAAALSNPTGIDRIDIGERESGTEEVPGSTLLSNFKIYSAAP